MKNTTFRGWGFTKNQYRGEDCLKREAWTVCQFMGRLDKKEGVVFLMGGLIPQCTLWQG